MEAMRIRNFTTSDSAEVLALNRDSVHFLSPMDEQRLDYLRRRAALFWLVEKPSQVLGFFIGFTDGSDYDSPNYLWFKQHLKNFLYIDRIVIAERARGQGLGKKIYASITAWAAENGLSTLAAEIDIEPPNPISLTFHQDQHFVALHRQSTGAGEKTVSLQAKFLP